MSPYMKYLPMQCRPTQAKIFNEMRAHHHSAGTHQVTKMSKVKEINEKIRENKVVVYSKTYCPFCTKAKSALKDAGLKDFVLIEQDEKDWKDDAAAIQDALQEITGARSVGLFGLNLCLYDHVVSFAVYKLIL